MNVSEYIFARLAELGVADVFLLPGGGCMHLVDALGREDRIRLVPLLHEQAVGIAAEAYAQVKNGLGVALVTTGPGGTNTVTAVAAAWLDSTPCLFLSGQVKTVDLAGDRGVRQFGFQEIDVATLVSSITKFAKTVKNAEEAVDAFEFAISCATSGRPGPVWLDVPLDVQASEVSVASISQVLDQVVLNEQGIEPLASAEIQKLIEHLINAQQPVMLVGNGVRLAKADAAAIAWARSKTIPVLTTWKSLDMISEDDELFAGRPGGVGSVYANRTLQEADLLICVGARLDLGQVGYRHDTFAKSADIFVVDIDHAELAKLEFENQTLINLDAGDFFAQLAPITASINLPNVQAWKNKILRWKSEFPMFQESEKHWEDGVSLYALIECVSDLMRPEDVFAPGSSGACSEISMQAFKVKAGQRVMNSEGLGSMGFGVPGAIGACIASGGRRTVCIDGDGGFAMNLQDLSSVYRMNLPLTFIVLDNNGYGSIQTTQDRYFEGRRVASDKTTGIELPNYDNIEAVFGIPTERVSSLWEFKREFMKNLELPGPSVTIVNVSPRQQTRFRVKTVFDSCGKPQTSQLDDLWYPQEFGPQTGEKDTRGNARRDRGHES